MQYPGEPSRANYTHVLARDLAPGCTILVRRDDMQSGFLEVKVIRNKHSKFMVDVAGKNGGLSYSLSYFHTEQVRVKS